MRNKSRGVGKGLALAAVVILSSTTLMSRQPEGDLWAPPVTIVRDEHGVPHVFGLTLEAVWYGAGYAQAQDRLWQAEMLRRAATGTSAELLGPSAVEADVQARTVFGSAARRAALFKTASPQMKRILTSFVAGINAGIEAATRTGTLPPEYMAFGAPRPWTVDDTIAEAMLLLRTLGEFGGVDELTEAANLQEWIGRLGPEAFLQFADTHWLNDPTATTSVPATGAVKPVRVAAASPTGLPSGIREAFERFVRVHREWERHLERVGLSRDAKSNAIAIAPKLSADGHALLLGGPQVGYSTPQLGHEVGLHGAGYDTTGMAIAGLPGIAVGVGAQHAWTLTSGVSKNNYIYVEKLNAQGQYLFNGTLRNLDCRDESIGVAGLAAPHTARVCESVHGPVIAAAPDAVFTLKSAVRGHEVKAIEAFHGMMRARSFKEFEGAVREAVYNLNVLYADAAGNIAYWHTGRIPVPAPGDNVWLPRDGSGSAEWQGFVPFAAMPRAVNPTQGWLASWNNKPSAAWNNGVSSGLGTWGPVHRVNTLVNLLNGLAPRSVTVDTLREINRMAGSTTDTPRAEGIGAAAPPPAAFNVFVSTTALVDAMLAHVDQHADSRLSGAWLLLRNWDGRQLDENPQDGFYDSPAVVLFNTWWQIMTARIFGDDFGPAFNGPVPTVNENIIANLTYRLLVPNAAIPLTRNYLGSESVGSAVTASLIAALDRMQVRFGSSTPGDWRQRVAEIVWTKIGAVQVPNTIWMNRGTYNQIVHLGKGAKLFGFNVVAPGQSGNPFSPYFADQLPLYATWQYKPMRLGLLDLLGNTTSTITLRVPAQ